MPRLYVEPDSDPEEDLIRIAREIRSASRFRSWNPESRKWLEGITRDLERISDYIEWECTEND